MKSAQTIIKHGVFMLLIVCMLLSLAGCSKDPQTPGGETADKWLTVPMSGDPGCQRPY